MMAMYIVELLIPYVPKYIVVVSKSESSCWTTWYWPNQIKLKHSNKCLLLSLTCKEKKNLLKNVIIQLPQFCIIQYKVKLSY